VRNSQKEGLTARAGLSKRGAPHSGLCRNFLGEHQVKIIEIMSYGGRVRSENGNTKLEVSGA